MGMSAGVGRCFRRPTAVCDPAVKCGVLCASVLAVRCLVLSCSRSVGRVRIKALLGHDRIATTQIYTNVGQERMKNVVGRL